MGVGYRIIWWSMIWLHRAGMGKWAMMAFYM